MFNEEEFLQGLSKRNTTVTIFTTNGFQMHGLIREIGKEAILFSDGGVEQMIYKHAISTIRIGRF